MNKRKKYGIIFSVVVFIVVFIIAIMSNIEINTRYDRNGENIYNIWNTKNIQPFDYNTSAVYVWFMGIIVISIFLYFAFVKRKEKNINKAQLIVLATIVPVILFISCLTAIQLSNISTLADAWFFIVVTLILIAVFEYDLFGNKTIISFFDFKLLIKMIILFIIIFIGIGILGKLIPPFIKTTISPITKEQYENYKGEKFDWYSLPKPTYKP